MKTLTQTVVQTKTEKKHYCFSDLIVGDKFMSHKEADRVFVVTRMKSKPWLKDRQTQGTAICISSGVPHLIYFGSPVIPVDLKLIPTPIEDCNNPPSPPSPPSPPPTRRVKSYGDICNSSHLSNPPKRR